MILLEALVVIGMSSFFLKSRSNFLYLKFTQGINTHASFAFIILLKAETSFCFFTPFSFFHSFSFFYSHSVSGSYGFFIMKTCYSIRKKFFLSFRIFFNDLSDKLDKETSFNNSYFI